MKPINWTKWAAIAEVLSSVAIVATLIYLAIQTQQNSAAIQANSRHAMIDTDVQMLMGEMANPISSIGNKEYPTDDELNRLEAWLIALVRTREHQWFQLQGGLLDRQAFEAYLSGLTGNLSTPRTRKWWEAMKYTYFDDEFVDAVSEYISDAPINLDPRPVIAVTDELDILDE